jgi:hypothetical protein
MDYQLSSSRSYSNYDIEPTSSQLDRKSHHGRRSQNNVNNNSNNSILPDFVQDHLMMDSFYNSESPSINMSPSGEEFNAESNAPSMNHQNRNFTNDPFDFANEQQLNRRHVNPIPLDLPSMNHANRTNSLDLPPDLMDQINGSNQCVAVQREETYGKHNEPEITREQAAIDKMQTLPDFLSDGPIHSNRLADVASISVDEDNHSLVMRLQQENDRLRMELNESRRVIVDLEQQIMHVKTLETQFNLTLAESMEQVEENLLATNQRAEAQANNYKQQIKKLNVSLKIAIV